MMEINTRTGRDTDLMDRAKLRLLQNLQDTYSAAHKLSILAVDWQGKLLTKPSLTESGEAIARLMKQLEGYDVYAAFERHAPYVREIHAVTRYDYETFLNMKYIIAPLKLPNEPNGTIWAGPCLDDSIRHSEQPETDKFRALPTGLLKAFDFSPSLQGSNSAEIMEKIGEFSEVAAAILKESEKEDRQAAEELHLLQAVNRWTSNSAVNMREDETLRLSMRTADLDFAGYARRMENERFEVVSAVGEECGTPLIGQSFHSGEGCLGHAALIRRRTVWEAASGKSAGNLFSPCCEPEWLVGYPIFVREEVQGVLFGGALTTRRPTPVVLELLQILANHWGNYLQGAGLQAIQKRQALLLSMLSEIHHSVSEMQDLKRILSIMVETMHKLIGGTFSSIVLFGEPERRAEAQVVSKGLDSEQIARYAGETSDRYRGSSSGLRGQKDRNPCYRKTSWGEPALEIPLYYGRRISGLLSVGVSERRTEESDRFFLASLAMIGEMRLYDLRQQEETSNRNNLELLGYSLSYWDPEGYPALLRKRELLGVLSQRLGFSQESRERIDQAYMISRYETSFLWEAIPWHSDAIMLLEEAMSVIERRGQADAYLEYGYSHEAQALALIIHRQVGEEMPEASVEELQSVALGVRTVFEELLEEQTPSVNLIAIGQVRIPREDDELDYAALTSREREVLELLIQGLTNQDIAEKMFISAHTVKNHLTKIYMKLGVADRTSAMVKLLKT